MTSSLFIRIKGIVQQLGCTWLIKNDDAGEFSVENESTRTIFKDTDEVLYSIRTAPADNWGNGEKRKYVASVLEYDRIKTVEIDLSVATLRSFLTEIGEDPNDFNDFIASHSYPKELKLEVTENDTPTNTIIDLSVKP